MRLREIGRKKNPCEDVAIVEVERFDDRFDRFFEKISAHFGFIALRDQKYLNWKFVEKPFSNYKLFAAIDKARQLSGYVVFKSDKSGEQVRGKILDILADPEKPEVFAALISKSIEEFARIKASYVEMACTYPPFIKLLKAIGFVRSRKPLGFMVRKWEGQFDREFVGDIKNWYLTFGDSDGDAWEVDSSEAWQTR